MTVLWNTLQTALSGQIPHLLGALAILLLGWLIAVVVHAGRYYTFAILGNKPSVTDLDMGFPDSCPPPTTGISFKGCSLSFGTSDIDVYWHCTMSQVLI